MPQCKAKCKSTGERCKRHANGGFSVCQVHGGGSPHKGRPGIGRPPITGRYSIRKAELASKAEVFLNDPTPGDLSDELVLLRTLLQDYLDRLFDMPEDDPLRVGSIDRVFEMVNHIGVMVERVAKILNSTALTQVEVKLLQARIVDLMLTYVPDAEARARFVAELAESFGSRSARSISDGDL